MYLQVRFEKEIKEKKKNNLDAMESNKILLNISFNLQQIAMPCAMPIYF